MDLSPDLKSGVVPISKAASAIASLIKQSRATRRPIVVTQKGSPTAVLLDVDLWLEVVELVKLAGDADVIIRYARTDETTLP